MSFVTASAIPNGNSKTFVLVDTWADFTVTYTPSDFGDSSAAVAVQGSADEGVTWFPLTTASQSMAASSTGTGAKVYAATPVNAIQVQVTCTSGNTMTVSATGR